MLVFLSSQIWIIQIFLLDLTFLLNSTIQKSYQLVSTIFGLASNLDFTIVSNIYYMFWDFYQNGIHLMQSLFPFQQCYLRGWYLFWFIWINWLNECGCLWNRCSNRITFLFNWVINEFFFFRFYISCATLIVIAS